MLTPSAGLQWCEMLLCEVSFATKHEYHGLRAVE